MRRSFPTHGGPAASALGRATTLGQSPEHQRPVGNGSACSSKPVLPSTLRSETPGSTHPGAALPAVLVGSTCGRCRGRALSWAGTLPAQTRHTRPLLLQVTPGPPFPDEGPRSQEAGCLPGATQPHSAELNPRWG